MVQDDRLLSLQGVTPQHRLFVESMNAELKQAGASDVHYVIPGALYLALQTQGYITETSDVAISTRLDDLCINESKLNLLVQEMVHQASWEHMKGFSGISGHKYQPTDTLYQLVIKFALEVNHKTKAYLAFVNEFSH